MANNDSVCQFQYRNYKLNCSAMATYMYITCIRREESLSLKPQKPVFSATIVVDGTLKYQSPPLNKSHP